MKRTDIHDLLTNNIIGDWCFSDDMKNMWLGYPVKSSYPGEPDQCDIVHLYIHHDEHDERTPSWHWDGNDVEPTLTPSINVIGRWHGWLRSGALITA